jgi:WD40 repeat protein
MNLLKTIFLTIIITITTYTFSFNALTQSDDGTFEYAPITMDNVDSLSKILTIDNEIIGGVYDLSWSDDMSALAIAGVGGVFVITNIFSEEARSISQIHDLLTHSVAFGSESNVLAFVDGYDIYIYDPVEGAIIWTREQSGVIEITYSQAINLWASGNGDGSITLWDGDDFDNVGQVNVGNDNGVSELAFSSDGQLLATTHQRLGTRLWRIDEIRNNRDIESTILAGSSSRSVAFSPDDELVATGFWASIEGGPTLQIWDRDQENERIIGGNLDTTIAVTFNVDGTLLISSGLERVIRIWDIETGKEVAALNDVAVLGGQTDGAYTDWVTTLSLSKDGSLLASGGYDGIVRVWGSS